MLHLPLTKLKLETPKFGGVFYHLDQLICSKALHAIYRPLNVHVLYVFLN